MKLSTFHCHTCFCDGRNTPEEMVEGAIAKGFAAIGFSSHADMLADPAAYCARIRNLKELYRGRIEVYLGLEAELGLPYEREEYDYVIGSVHYVDGVSVDNTPQILFDGIRDRFGGSARKLIERYHEIFRERIAEYDFDIIGHPDVYTKYNIKHPFFDPSEAWYRAELVKSADAIAATGKIVEVNTGAIGRGWRTDAYPADEYRALLRERGVKFILNSDSHSVDSLDAGYDKYLVSEPYSDFSKYLLAH